MPWELGYENADRQAIAAKLLPIAGYFDRDTEKSSLVSGWLIPCSNMIQDENVRAVVRQYAKFVEKQSEPARNAVNTNKILGLMALHSVSYSDLSSYRGKANERIGNLIDSVEINAVREIARRVVPVGDFTKGHAYDRRGRRMACFALCLENYRLILDVEIKRMSFTVRNSANKIVWDNGRLESVLGGITVKKSNGRYVYNGYENNTIEAMVTSANNLISIIVEKMDDIKRCLCIVPNTQS